MKETKIYVRSNAQQIEKKKVFSFTLLVGIFRGSWAHVQIIRHYYVQCKLVLSEPLNYELKNDSVE